VTEYLAWLKEAPGRGGRARRDSTVKLVAWRLRGLLRVDEGEDYPLWALTRSKARVLFAQREAEVKVDTIAGELATVHRACGWWVKRGWLDADPFVACEVKGSRSVGKPQLRTAEARRFQAVALTEGTPGLASVVALRMGMRASEITGLIVRDLDEGTMWITKAKTKRGIRRLDVPEDLLPYLLRLAAGRAPTEPLFGEVDRHWLHRHTVRICNLAGVPIVTPHGLRGTFATLAVGAGDTRRAAEALGHDEKMTTNVYAAPGAVQSGLAGRVAQLLASGQPETSTLVTAADTSLPGPLDPSDVLLN
jgi:integrase